MSINDPLSPIRLQVMWNRLIAVVEEQAQALVRTAFSTSTREAGDLSAGVFDLDGRMLAQAVTGTPGHVNSMARAVGHFLDKFPVDDHEAKATSTSPTIRGRAPAICTTSPSSRRPSAAASWSALFACTCHVVDIGGRGMSARRPPGLRGRPLHPADALRARGQGRRDADRHRARQRARAGPGRWATSIRWSPATRSACRRLIEMMDEFGIDDLDELGSHILEKSAPGHRSRRSASCRPAPTSTTMRIDGYDEPIDLRRRP